MTPRRPAVFTRRLSGPVRAVGRWLGKPLLWLLETTLDILFD
jgi:hypothetical protein